MVPSGRIVSPGLYWFPSMRRDGTRKGRVGASSCPVLSRSGGFGGRGARCRRGGDYVRGRGRRDRSAVAALCPAALESDDGLFLLRVDLSAGSVSVTLKPPQPRPVRGMWPGFGSSSLECKTGRSEAVHSPKLRCETPDRTVRRSPFVAEVRGNRALVSYPDGRGTPRASRRDC